MEYLGDGGDPQCAKVGCLFFYNSEMPLFLLFEDLLFLYSDFGRNDFFPYEYDIGKIVIHKLCRRSINNITLLCHSKSFTHRS